jgi:hypothetical protein
MRHNKRALQKLVLKTILGSSKLIKRNLISELKIKQLESKIRSGL